MTKSISGTLYHRIEIRLSKAVKYSECLLNYYKEKFFNFLKAQYNIT